MILFGNLILNRIEVVIICYYYILEVISIRVLSILYESGINIVGSSVNLEGLVIKRFKRINMIWFFGYIFFKI